MKILNRLIFPLLFFVTLAAALFSPSPARALPRSCKIILGALDRAFPERLEKLSPRRIDRLDAQKLILAPVFEKLEGVFGRENASADRVITEITKDDVREWIFQVEAVMRLYHESDLIGAESGNRMQKAMVRVMDKTLQSFTDLENNIGGYTDAIQWNQWVGDLHDKYGDRLISPEIASYFQRNLKNARKNFGEFLRKAGWLDGRNSKPLKMLDASLRVMNSIPSAENKKYLLERISRYLKATENRDFDMRDLENGIHPFRRHLRWFSLMVQASNMFKLDRTMDPLPAFRNLKLDSPEMLKYAQVEITGNESHPVLLSRSLFYEVIKLVGDLGNAKDIGQFEQVLVQAFEAVDPGKEKSWAVRQSEIVASYVPNYVNPWITAAQNYKLVHQTGLLRELKREIEGGSR